MSESTVIPLGTVEVEQTEPNAAIVREATAEEQAGRPLEACPIALDGHANDERSDYWLEHSEGFQVFAPDGRIGFVAFVLFSEEGVTGLVVRTGMFRTQGVFVPIHEVASIVPRRQRIELLITPRVLRAPVSDIVRELFAPLTG